MDQTSATNRRDFLKTSTIAAVGAAATQLTLQSAVYASGDDTVKVGLVGCGGRGTGAASQALSTQGNVKLVGVADAFEDSAKNSLKNLKSSLGEKADRVAVKDENIFTGFDAYQKLIDSGIDLVILATPPGFRPIHFEYAVKAGKNIFKEKPVAVDAPGVRQVLEANKIAKEKKLKVGVGLQRHHQAGYLETISRLKDGAIGDILALRVYWNGGGVWDPRITRAQAKSEMEYQMRNWYYYNWLCGDHICEQHIHNLDVGNWLKGGPPVRANGMGGRQVRVDKKYGEIYDHHYVEYEFADGTYMYSQCRHIPNCWNSVSESASGSKGTVDISGYKIKPVGGEEWSFGRGGRRAGGDPYQVEHDDLFAAIRSGAEYNEADNGAMSTMTSILGRMATYSGKVITMEDALASNISLMPKTFAWDADPPVMPKEDGSYPIATPGVTKVV
ncbi:MAG: Gfo/Idh/MocA family oxidoreductase [Planctomycetaceae bacterium]|nr:Gfo/Idh/MocA family oxidoreductase [Planctomycetaceae bacterium]